MTVIFISRVHLDSNGESQRSSHISFSPGINNVLQLEKNYSSQIEHKCDINCRMMLKINLKFINCQSLNIYF